MRVRGNNAPSGALSVEPHPQKPGIAIVRFFENPEPFEEKQGELTIKGWEYDEYHLELPLYDNLALDVSAAYDIYIQQAKADEEEAKWPEASLLELLEKLVRVIFGPGTRRTPENLSLRPKPPRQKPQETRLVS